MIRTLDIIVKSLRLKPLTILWELKTVTEEPESDTRSHLKCASFIVPRCNLAPDRLVL